MSQFKISRTIVLLVFAFSVVSCGKNQASSVSDQPVTDVGREGDAPEAKTLFQKVLENGVPEIPLREAFDYYDKHQSIIKNKKYISIADYSQNSSHKRYYLIDMKTGVVDKIIVAHGRNSDPDHDGNATIFSNKPGSLTTSLGFMLTAEHYTGHNGLSLRLDGLESINSNVRAREIVIHGATYVDPSLAVLGRSSGCPAVEKRLIVSLIKNIENGSLFYAYYTGL
jgi:hypothetical protein